jgi:hypothetical protein
MPKGDPRKNIFPIRFTDGEYRKVKKASAKEHMSLVSWIRQLILKVAEKED